MDDILRHVVFAVGDEDLLAEQAIGSILGALRPGSHGVEIGPRLRLGEVHGSRPPPADHLRQIGVGELARAMRLQGPDRALGQERAEREGHRGAVPDFRGSDVDEMGEAHAAELGRRGDAVPACLRPASVDVGEARGCSHHAVFISRAIEVADPIERRDLLRGEAPRFRDDGRNRFPIEVAHDALG